MNDRKNKQQNAVGIIVRGGFLFVGEIVKLSGKVVYDTNIPLCRFYINFSLLIYNSTVNDVMFSIIDLCAIK